MLETNFRALCAELVVIEDAMSGGSVQLSSQGQALDGYAGLAAFRYIAAKARIALAQPEPQGPTDEEAVALYSEVMVVHECQTLGDMAGHFARAVLARWGTPANNISEENLEVFND